MRAVYLPESIGAKEIEDWAQSKACYTVVLRNNTFMVVDPRCNPDAQPKPEPKRSMWSRLFKGVTA